MARISWHDCDRAGARNPSHAVDRDFEFPLDHFVDFFLGMKMLMNGRAASELVVRESHARRVEIASMPARQSLNYLQIGGIHKGHTTNVSTGGLTGLMAVDCLFYRGLSNHGFQQPWFSATMVFSNHGFKSHWF